jgi:hypothetical protein
MAVKEAQAKSSSERQERKTKVAQSRRMIEDTKRATALAARETTMKIEQLKLIGKAKEEHDKRVKAEEEKKR